MWQRSECHGRALDPVLGEGGAQPAQCVAQRSRVLVKAEQEGHGGVAAHHRAEQPRPARRLTATAGGPAGSRIIWAGGKKAAGPPWVRPTWGRARNQNLKLQKKTQKKDGKAIDFLRKKIELSLFGHIFPQFPIMPHFGTFQRGGNWPFHNFACELGERGGSPLRLERRPGRDPTSSWTCGTLPSCSP